MTDIAISQYLGKFSITIIKRKYHLFVLSLGVITIMSVVMVTFHDVIAQTIDSIMEEENIFGSSPQIIVGGLPHLAINDLTNKIYSANEGSNTVSVIDSNFGNPVKNIHVGKRPLSIAVDDTNNKIYVANSASN